MAPSRPSGASKKKPANQEGGQLRGRDRGGGQSHLPRNPIDLAANQHCQTLLSPQSSVKTVDGWLPGRLDAPFLDEKWQQLQRQKMDRRADMIAAPDALQGPGAVCVTDRTPARPSSYAVRRARALLS